MENLKHKGNWSVSLSEPKKQRALFFGVVIFNLVLAAILIWSPVTSIKGAESSVAYTIQATMLNKAAMYTDPEAAPFSATQYNPLYYIVTSSVANLFSFTPGSDVVSIYRTARFISFLASVGAGYFIFLILANVFHLSRQWSGWLAVTAIVCTVPWYYALRPDSMMALSFFASFYFFLRSFESKKSVQYLLTAGTLAALCFFSKQNGLIIALIIGSFLMFTLRIKNLLAFVVGYFAGVGFFSLLFIPFYSPFFIKNILQGINNGIDVQQAILVPYSSFASRFGVLALVILILVWIVYATHSRQSIAKQFHFLTYSIVILFPFSIVTALKIGSDINYFHELIGLLIIMAGASLLVLKNDFGAPDNSWTKPALFILLFAFVCSMTISSFLDFGLRNMKRINELAEVYPEDLLGYLRGELSKTKTPAMVLSDYSFVNNALPKNCIVPQPDISLLWYDRKIYDFAELKKSIADGRVQFYAGNGFLFRYFKMDLDHDFKLLKHFGSYDLYINKHTQP